MSQLVNNVLQVPDCQQDWRTKYKNKFTMNPIEYRATNEHEKARNVVFAGRVLSKLRKGGVLELYSHFLYHGAYGNHVSQRDQNFQFCEKYKMEKIWMIFDGYSSMNGKVISIDSKTGHQMIEQYIKNGITLMYADLIAFNKLNQAINSQVAAYDSQMSVIYDAVDVKEEDESAVRAVSLMQQCETLTDCRILLYFMASG